MIIIGCKILNPALMEYLLLLYIFKVCTLLNINRNT